MPGKSKEPHPEKRKFRVPFSKLDGSNSPVQDTVLPLCTEKKKALGLPVNLPVCRFRHSCPAWKAARKYLPATSTTYKWAQLGCPPEEVLQLPAGKRKGARLMKTYIALLLWGGCWILGVGQGVQCHGQARFAKIPL